MTKKRYITPGDIRREYLAMQIIDLVVDEHMTIQEAAEAVGVPRSTWYYWVEQGKVDDLLKKKQEEIRAGLKLALGRSSEERGIGDAHTHSAPAVSSVKSTATGIP